MTIYVDELFNWPQEAATAQARKYFGGGKPSCHLFTDGAEAELIVFARRIGLQPAWIQRGTRLHFDLTPKKRAMAVRAGAVELTREEYAALFIQPSPECPQTAPVAPGRMEDNNQTICATTQPEQL